MNDTITPGVLIAGVFLVTALGGGVYGIGAFLAAAAWVSIKFIDEKD